jgi:RimJ/RimL family protein N-acetyltransferase
MSGWRLERVRDDDQDALYALFCLPPVYRHLADGAPPPRPALDLWLARSREDFEAVGVGLWLLRDERDALSGCLRLETLAAARSAEITWVLDPHCWGRGLATRMAWSAIEAAFRGPHLDRIVAGADGPNAVSFAVMKRLGMRFLRQVDYPAGPGQEWVLERGDPPPDPLPAVIRIAPA